MASASITEKNKTSLAAKASLWYAVCSVLQKCIGLIVIPIYTRLMSEGDYGTYVVFQSWTEIVAIFVTLNLGSYVFNNGMMKFKNDRDGFASSMLGLTGLIGIAWMIIFLVAPSFWSGVFGLAAPYVFLLVLRCIVLPSYSYWSAKLRYEFRYKPVVALTLVLSIATPVASIPAILFSSDKVAAALVVQVLVMMIVYLVPLCSIIKRSRNFFSIKYWVFALKFNLPLIPHLLSTVILQQADRIMISNICGSAFAAIYSVAYSAGLAMSFIHSAIVQALTPWMYQTIEAKDYGRIQPVSMAILAIVGGASLLLTLFAPEIMMLLAPASYYEGIYAIPPVAACVILMTAFNLFVTVEYYFEETLWVMTASIIAAVLNVALNFLLLPVFGFLAAAYTTLLCYFLLVVGHCVLMRKAMKKHGMNAQLFDLKHIYGIIILFVGLMVACSAIYSHIAIRYSILAVFALAIFVKRSWIKEKIDFIMGARAK